MLASVSTIFRLPPLVALLAIFASFAIDGAAMAQMLGTSPPPAAHDLIGCGDDTRPAIELAWVEAPSAEAFASVSGGEVTLRFTNTTSQTVLARPELALERSGRLSLHKLPEVSVPAGEHVDLAIPLAPDGLAMPAAHTSSVAVHAQLSAAHDRRLGQSASAVLYARGESGTRVAVFGEGELRRRLADGRLPESRRLAASVVPPGVTLEMVFEVDGEEQRKTTRTEEVAP